MLAVCHSVCLCARVSLYCFSGQYEDALDTVEKVKLFAQFMNEGGETAKDFIVGV